MPPRCPNRSEWHALPGRERSDEQGQVSSLTAVKRCLTATAQRAVNEVTSQPELEQQGLSVDESDARRPRGGQFHG